MFIGPAQMVMNAFDGGIRQTAAQNHMFNTLSAKYSGNVGAQPGTSYISSLLDLSRTDADGTSMFDVLSIESNARNVMFDLMRSAGVFDDDSSE